MPCCFSNMRRPEKCLPCHQNENVCCAGRHSIHLHIWPCLTFNFGDIRPAGTLRKCEFSVVAAAAYSSWCNGQSCLVCRTCILASSEKTSHFNGCLKLSLTHALPTLRGCFHGREHLGHDLQNVPSLGLAQVPGGSPGGVNLNSFCLQSDADVLIK